MARIEQIRLVFFILRHLVGVGVFVWLTVETRRLGDGGFYLVVGGLGIVYAAFAFFSGRKLLHLYRRRLASAQMGRREPSATVVSER